MTKRTGPKIVASGEGSYIVEARASLEDVSKAIGFDFSALADAEDVDTIGGLLTAAAGRVPGRGEIVTGPGDFEFEVLDADPRRVKRLKILPRAAPRRRGAVESARAEQGDGAASARRAAARRSMNARAENSNCAASALCSNETRIAVTGKSSLSLQDSAPLPREGALRVFARNVILAWGWPRRAIAFFGGAMGALAMPPLSFAPALIAPLALAVWLIDGSVDRGPREATRWASLSAAFGAGWWWGFGYFTAGLWWLGSAFLVEPDKFAWALPLGVLGLPAMLAFFPAAGFALARLLWRPGAARVLALAVGLGASEWLRCVAFTGFPWNEIGMALGQNVVLAQIASIVGLHGLTLAAVAIFAAPATLWTESEASAPLGPDDFGGSRARRDRRLRRVSARRAGERARFPASNCASCSPTSRKARISRRTTGLRSCAVTSPCPIARPRPRLRGWRTSRI